ncbi:YbaB/EbfC family nucleoid-associated protein [Nocardia flavorosea]|uniref:YbaB/EbfC family nucleoid-associated protein n=2 Tax=Nocardia flavorosea TaxID=53429 RepID=A0A846Y5Z1_9NOCA|nr:YbaB/EbfC family nucleoid-associated protein [Nocardia flavorosea]
MMLTMWNGRITEGRSEMEAVLSGLHEQVRRVAEIEQQRAELTVTVATPDMRVTVTVDAQGHLTDLRFSSDISTLSYEDIAAAVISTARRAVVEVGERSAELFEPLNEHRAVMPGLSELFEGFPDVELPFDPSAAPVAAVNHPDVADQEIVPVATTSLVSVDVDEDDLVMEYEDAVELGTDSADADNAAVTDRGWV